MAAEIISPFPLASGKTVERRRRWPDEEKLRKRQMNCIYR